MDALDREISEDGDNVVNNEFGRGVASSTTFADLNIEMKKPIGNHEFPTQEDTKVVCVTKRFTILARGSDTQLRPCVRSRQEDT